MKSDRGEAEGSQRERSARQREREREREKEEATDDGRSTLSSSPSSSF